MQHRMMLGRHTFSYLSTQHWRGERSASTHGCQQFGSIYLMILPKLIDLFTDNMPTTKPLASNLPYSIAKSKLFKTIYAVFFLFVEVVGPFIHPLGCFGNFSVHLPGSLLSLTRLFTDAPTQLACNGILNWRNV